MRFTLFDTNGYTIQSAPSLVDLLADPQVQGHDLDLTACMVLIEDGLNGNSKRVLSLGTAIADYVDPTERAQRVTAIHEQATRMASVARWLEAVPMPEVTPVEPDPVGEPEPEREAVPAGRRSAQ